MGRKDQTNLRLTIALLVCGLAVFILPDWAIFMGTLALAKGVVVIGLLVLWRTGLVSFGQALYFGLGGYTVGLLGLRVGMSDAVLLTLLSFLLSAAVAMTLGLIISRYREIFFAMLTMAFSMILYGVLVKTEALGSTDGFNVLLPTYLGYAPEGEAQRVALYLWSLLVAYLASLGVHRYLRSALGNLTSAIRDNEIRVEYLGVSVQRAIYFKYVIAGALTGAGGAITAMAVGHVDPEMTYWTTSGEFVFVTILSGTGHVVAPFVGSIIFELVRTYAFEYAPYAWQLVLGSVLLLLIMFLPNGLWSLVTRMRKKG